MISTPRDLGQPRDLYHVTLCHGVAERKSSLTRKVSQYFKSLYSNDYEVDLV